jgi:hypothetical protein
MKKNNANSKSFSSSDDEDDYDDNIVPRGGTQGLLGPNGVTPNVAANLKNKTRHSISVKKHYIAMKKEELKEQNITGLRYRMAMVLASKPVDISLIVLIILYTIMVIVFLAFDDSFYDDHPNLELSFQIIELFFLFLF